MQIEIEEAVSDGSESALCSSHTLEQYICLPRLASSITYSELIRGSNPDQGYVLGSSTPHRGLG